MGCKREKAEAVIQSCYGNSLKISLEIHGVKSQNFFKLLSEVPSLDEEYTRAQHARSEMFMDQMIEIADDKEIDPNRARNMIQVRQTYAAKMKPNKFGERIDVNLNQQIDIRGALDEARSRIRDVLDISKMQVIDTKQEVLNPAVGSQPTTDESPVEIKLGDLLD